jgi:hypothetical protein
MAKKPDKREVCEKLFAHRIKQRQGLQRNQRAVDNASSTGENEKNPGASARGQGSIAIAEPCGKGAIARSQGYAGLSKLANSSAPGEQSPRKRPRVPVRGPVALRELCARDLATFRRKIDGLTNGATQSEAKRSPSEWPTGSAGRKIAGADLWD